MTNSVCFKCGGDKFEPTAKCEACAATPRTDSDLALSLVLSEHLSTRKQLLHLAHEIRNHLRLTMPSEHLAQAREALKDPQLLTMLRLGRAPPQPLDSKAPVSREKTTPQKSMPGAPNAQAQRRLQTSVLHQNPFALLGVTTRDDRRRIVELAEEKSLHLDHDACQKARSDLTSPRTRLNAEMAWLPGLSPRRASLLADALLAAPMSIRTESGLPVLAHLNLMAAAFEAVGGQDKADDVAEFVQEMAFLVDELSAEQILRDINEDRSVSGFPQVQGVEQIEAGLSERKRYYRNCIKNALDRLSPAALVDAMTAAVDGTTCGGSEHAPELIDDLVDSYAVETQAFLQKEAENAQQLISAVRRSARSGEGVVRPLVDKLDAVARNWDKIAQPIQLSAKARGIDHQPSTQIAYSIRSLAVDLFNEHGMLAESQKLTALIKELFAELPEVSERAEEDAETLEDILQQRKASEAQDKEWEREITYSAEVGLVFKDILSVSPEGLSWKNQCYPLDTVTRVRWGAVRHSVNGIPTGTNYTIAFGDNRSEAIVELKKELTYTTFIQKLWRAVGIRLLMDMLETLKSGKELCFGEARLRDDGIVLVKHKFFGSNEPVLCSWAQVQVWSADGSFYIGDKSDKKTYVGVSYIGSANTHVLEQAIRMGFKKPGMQRLSDLMQ